MENNYLYEIQTKFKYTLLNSDGVEREILEAVDKKDIYRILEIATNNDIEVDKAIEEYNVQTHKVMRRRNKPRKGQSPYIVEKLPRNKQQYINEVELFFIFGKPVLFSLESGDSEAFAAFKAFWRKYSMDDVFRQAKRLAGAETESAIMFRITNEGGSAKIRPFVVARSRGYRLRTVVDQYGDLITLAYEYTLRERGTNVQHCDIHTKDFSFYCHQGADGWVVRRYINPIGKIMGLYFKQTKAWDGAVARIDREERLDSKVGDTNNYFADPKAACTADVVASISDPDVAGNLVQLSGAHSRFEYINPPQNSVTRQDEKSDLHRSIFFDTMTPDLSYESIKGLGTLSGAAMHNALITGYIKKGIREEVYKPMVGRAINLCKELMKLTDSKVASKVDSLDISYEFQDPFSQPSDNWGSIIQLYSAGLCSLETAISKIGLAKNIDEEIDRIRAVQMELEYMKNLAISESNEEAERRQAAEQQQEQ